MPEAVADLMMEPAWWGDRDAAEARRALTEAFQVEKLESAAADLRARCEQLEQRRSCSEIITVGEVADVLLGQWSVAFQARLADSQRAFCAWADHDRLQRAAEDGRAAAVAVRDRYLAPERISGHSLQQALNLANADASGLQLDRSDTHQRRQPDEAERSEAKGGVIADNGVSDAGLGLLPPDRVTELINPVPADAMRARIVANERARKAAQDQPLIHDDDSAVRLDRVKRRGMSM